MVTQLDGHVVGGAAMVGPPPNMAGAMGHAPLHGGPPRAGHQLAGPHHAGPHHVGPHHAAYHHVGPLQPGTHHAMGQKRRYPPRNRNQVQERLPLDEAAKREMATHPSKTPVSVLQELLARRGTVPKYELVQIEGMIHEPTFRYRVTVADIVAMGSGRSKKEAKHSAAKALLDKLTGVTTSDAATNGEADPQSSVASPYDDKLAGNPVGWLQEMCMGRLWPPPSYSTEHDEDQTRSFMPHERQFTVACTLLRRRELGVAKSKKLAKRQAAHKMWLSLQETSLDAAASTEDVSLINTNNVNAYAELKDSKIPTLTTSHSHKVSQFHKHLKHTVGPNLAKLQVTHLNMKDVNYVQYLQEIASEQAFEVTYVDIEEKSHTGRNQCLVQLSTLPVAVCYGSGQSSKEAQASAAQNALEYLKIMTKK